MPYYKVRPDLYLGLSELQREQGLRKEAGQNLAQSQSLGDKSALPDWPYPPQPRSGQTQPV